MIRLLLISSLYPNSEDLQYGIFVETRLQNLLASGQVQAQVIAPVPWFPSLLRGLTSLRPFSQYKRYIDVPACERLQGVTVYHPRYLVIPKLGMLLTPIFMALSILLALFKVRKHGYTYDLVDAHYYYPDGVAVAILAKLLNRPIVITARGSDINLIPEAYLPRKMILWAARRATASVTVCQALARRMIDMGAEPENIHVFRNGVDLELFKPKDYDVMRNKWRVNGVTLLSVGHLVERKGHGLVIEALLALPNVNLIIAGDGVLRRTLEEKVARLNFVERVKFVGVLQQGELAELYSAADVLVLASSREGWANVLLEAMGCGTPVVAVDIWGTPEVVCHRSAGVLVKERSPEGLAQGITRLLESQPDRKATRHYAEGFSWKPTVEGLVKLYGDLIESPAINSAMEKN